MSHFREQLKFVDKDIWDEKHFSKQEKLIDEEIKAYRGMNAEEKRLWKLLLKNIQNDRETSMTDASAGRFKISQIDALGIPYDVLFVRSKKGTGKTFQIGRIIDRLAESDPNGQLIYMRSTRQEIENLDSQFFSNENFPIFKKGQDLFHKVKKKYGKKRFMGKCVYLTGENTRSLQGPDWKDFKVFIYDECNYTASQYGIKERDLEKLIILWSSLTRDKKDVKFYMFGNTLRNDDGTTSDIFLDRLKIEPGTNLKIIKQPTPDGSDSTTILYIDFGDKLRGIESQKYISIFGSPEDLLSNKPEVSSPKILGKLEFLRATPWFAYVFTYEFEELALYVGVIDTSSIKYMNQSEQYLIIRIEPYNHRRTYLYRPCTRDIRIFNKYRPRMMMPEHDNVQEKFVNFEFCMRQSKCWYSGEESDIMLSKMMKSWKSEYDLDWEKSDWI